MSDAMPVPTKSLLLFLIMVGAACLTVFIRPYKSAADLHMPVVLEQLVPSAFGDWKELAFTTTQIIDPQQQQSLEKVYSQTLSRTYTNPQGYRIMLSLVYGKTQRGDLQLHHPEICYPAQGFEVISNHTAQLSTAYGPIPVRRLETKLSAERIEPVTYWAMVGDQIVLGSMQRKAVELRYGLRGYTVDGLLFRISSIDAGTDRAFSQQTLFVSQLLSALSPGNRRILAGV
ncbi:MAG: exosortase-associated EpsI family protein [Pseudomonadota bacterium]